jgi:TatD DNase family protein
MIIDTHIHLYAEQFDADRDQLIREAIAKEVKRFFTPNIDSSTFNSMFSLQKQYAENCFPMLGLHPCSVKENFENELHAIEKKLETEKIYGIGETGIDLYWDKTFFDQQKLSLKKHIAWAVKHNLPLILHTRNSLNETINLVRENHSENLKGIFHCFGGNVEQANEIIDMGFYLGIGGVLTFKKSGLDELVKQIPLGKIVLETDAPYLAPVPFRGKRNEPSYIILVAQKLAEIKNISVEEVAEVTSANAGEVFKI